jgi:DNA repair exonuclease SbcCD ATPase subunit
MSETPSKLRQPRKLSAKIDLEALNEGRFDPTLIENLRIDQQATEANVIENNSTGTKKRKPQSPARIGGNSFKIGGPTMTSVPRRSVLSQNSRPSSVFKAKQSVFPQAVPIVRKPVASSINFGGPMKSLVQVEEDEESKAKIKELEEIVEKLTQELAEHSKHQSDLKGQLSESEQRVMNLDNFRKNLESRVNNKEQENSRFEEEIKKLENQIQLEREEASNYSNRIKNDLNEKLQHLQVAKVQVEHELKNCRSSLNSVEDELTVLKGTLNRQSSTVLDLESQIAALKAKLQAAQAEIISRSMQCDELTHKLSEAERIIEDLKTKLQEGK